MDRLVDDVIPLTDLRANLTRSIDRLEAEGGRLIITRKGKAAAVILSARDFDRLRNEAFVRGKLARALEDLASNRVAPHARVMASARKLAHGRGPKKR